MATFTNLPPEISQQYDALERRRKLREAMMSRPMMTGQPTQYVGGRYGRAVPTTGMAGAADVSKAIVNLIQGRREAAKRKELARTAQTQEQAVIDSMMQMREGSPGWEQSGPMQPNVERPMVGQVEADPVKAALEGYASPYAGPQRVANAIMSNRGRKQGRGEYVISGELWDDQQQQMVPVLYNRRVPQGHPMSVTYLDGSPLPSRMLSGKGPQARAAIKGAETMGTGMATRQLDKPMEQAGVESQQRKQSFVSDLIQEAKDDSGFFTAGFIGKMGSFVPGTPQYNLSKKLETIKANLGFDKLQEMRDASKTGGALGQISNREIDFLQAVWSSVEQGQSTAELDKNLDRVDDAIKAVVDGKVDRYNRLYPSSPYPKQDRGIEGKSTKGFDDAEKEKRYQEWKAKQQARP